MKLKCPCCGKELNNEKESIKHEAFCKKSPDRIYKLPLYLFFRFGFWPLIIIGIGYFLYSTYINKVYRFESWVYACPSSNTSKCYKVKADISPKECEEVEIDIRGNSGGHCTDPSVEKVFFNNGGHISFEYCEMEEKNKWTCYAENAEDGVWDIDFIENKKIKRE